MWICQKGKDSLKYHHIQKRNVDELLKCVGGNKLNN